jgi:hypothetical protein
MRKYKKSYKKNNIKRKRRITKKNRRGKYGYGRLFKRGGDTCKYEATDADWQQNKDWPLNFGCSASETQIILPIGKRLDRIGWSKGYFLGEPGYSFDSRSLRTLKSNKECKVDYENRLNKGSFPNLIEYHQYEVLKPFSAMTCEAKPFFGHKGGAVQYRLFENSITDSNDLAKITEKNDISDKNGMTKPPTKVANVQELLDLGFIKGVTIDNPPSFL